MKKGTRQYITDFLIVFGTVALIWIVVYWYTTRDARAQGHDPFPPPGAEEPVPEDEAPFIVGTMRPGELDVWLDTNGATEVLFLVPVRDERWVSKDGQRDGKYVTRVLVVVRREAGK